MKLKTFNATNTSNRGKGTTPHLTIHRSGLFTFSMALAEKMSIEIGQSLIFHQDQENKRDWYIEILPLHREHSWPIRDKGKSYCIQSAPLARMVLESSKASPGVKSASFRIKPEPTKIDGRQMWLIFTNPVKERA